MAMNESTQTSEAFSKHGPTHASESSIEELESTFRSLLLALIKKEKGAAPKRGIQFHHVVTGRMVSSGATVVLGKRLSE